LPVTVKTRLGWDDKSIKIQEVALRLQDTGIKALSIHGRTRKQMYKGQADWTFIEEVAAHPDIEIPIFGNGDVDSPQKAEQMKELYPHVSGFMIGRGSIGNPWIFQQIKHYLKTGEELPKPSPQEVVDVCRRHLLMSVDWKTEIGAIREMRRHYTAYFKGLPHFKELRLKLVTSDDLQEILDTLDYIEQNYRIPVGHHGQIPSENPLATKEKVGIQRRKKPKLKTVRNTDQIKEKLKLKEKNLGIQSSTKPSVAC